MPSSEVNKYYKSQKQIDHEKRRDLADSEIDRYYSGEISHREMKRRQYKHMGWSDEDIKENEWDKIDK